jgi:histone acetyltransferase (RNA polymerase elongator complex component)
MDEPVEICYFGGSFTCFSTDLMVAYLECVRHAPAGSRIRLSTHPLGIDRERLRILKRYPVSVAELGIASFDDKVLADCGRGYDRSLIMSKLSLMLEEGFTPGLQVMLGLPGQQRQDLLQGLADVAVMKGDRTLPLRIYPCLVLRGTALERRLKEGSYTPLPLDEAVRWAGELILQARDLGFSVIRVGLHETPALSLSVAAGPHHPALGEMARGHALALELVRRAPRGPWVIPSRDISLLTGHGRRGLATLGRLAGLTLPEVQDRLSFTG